MEAKSIPTQGMSKEKLIEAAKKAGIHKSGGGGDSTKGIQMFMQQQGSMFGQGYGQGTMPGMMVSACSV